MTILITRSEYKFVKITNHLLDTEMCNRPRLVIDYPFFQSNRNRKRNRSFLQNSNRNRNPNPVKKIAFDDYNHRKV